MLHKYKQWCLASTQIHITPDQKKNQDKKNKQKTIRLFPYAIKQASYQFITQLYVSTVWQEALQTSTW